MNPPRYAVFLIGGAANGKSAVLRTYFRLVPADEGDETGDDHLPEIAADRKLDPDEFKSGIAMYSDAPDEDAKGKFGRKGLGGASGPKKKSDFEKYKVGIRVAVEAYIKGLLDVDLAGFVKTYLGKHNPAYTENADWDFGGGLTHELSKVVAELYLERFLDEKPPAGSFAWDAVGNAETYRDWIIRARDAGYLVRVLYVRAPLPVAQMWALQRPRRLQPKLIKSTYEKAAKAADEIERFVQSLGDPDSVAFQQIETGSAHLKIALAAGYTDDGPPARSSGKE